MSGGRRLTLTHGRNKIGIRITPAHLRDFWKEWTGERILDLLAQEDSGLLIGWPIGWGKSHNMDDVIEFAVKSNRYDLIIALFPTRRVLEERRWIKNPPRRVPIINLRPRPAELCGEHLDRQWEVFEENGLGALGRRRLCGPCPNRAGCFWPDQRGSALQRARVIFCTQAHLAIDPNFIPELRSRKKAQRALVLLDEVNFIGESFRRRIKREDLENFLQVMEVIYERKDR